MSWFYDPKGVYFVKSRYHVVTEHKDEHMATALQNDSRWWKTMWNLDLPSKIKVFLWQACTNSLLMAERLFARTLNLHSRCDICKLALESIEHVLLICPDVRKIWEKSTFGNKLPKFKKTKFLNAMTNTKKQALDRGNEIIYNLIMVDLV